MRYVLDIAVFTATELYLEGSLPARLFMDAGNNGVGLSRSGGFIDDSTWARIEELRQELGAGDIVVPDLAAGPASRRPTPSVSWQVAFDGQACTSDIPPGAVAGVGELLQIDFANRSGGPAGIGLTEVAPGTSMADANRAASVLDLAYDEFPWSFAMAPSDGNHGISVALTYPGTWMITCSGTDSSHAAGFLVIEEAQAGGTSIEVAVEFDGERCTSDLTREPLSLHSDLVVSFTNASETQIAGFEVARVVTNTTAFDIERRGIGAVALEIAETFGSIEPGMGDLRTVRLRAPGTWAINCYRDPERVSRPAGVFTVAGA